jgi:hypothetical protein
MKKWEYYITTSFEEVKNLGKEGWKLIKTTPDLLNWYIMEREIIELLEPSKSDIQELSYKSNTVSYSDFKKESNNTYFGELLKPEPILSKIEFDETENKLIFFFPEFTVVHKMRSILLLEELKILFIWNKKEINVNSNFEGKYKLFSSIRSDINAKFAEKGLKLKFQNLLNMDKYHKKIYRIF